MNKSVYYRTWNEGSTRIHLEGWGDVAFCGFDLAGDDTIHDKDPIELDGFHRVTCEHCKQLLEIAKNHFEKREPPTKAANEIIQSNQK